MQVKTIIFWEAHVLVVCAVIGVLVWRYWYVPRHEARTRPPVAAVQPQPAPVAPAPAAVAPAPAAGAASVRPATAAALPVARATANMVKNGDFQNGMASWLPWGKAKDFPRELGVIELKKVPALRGLRLGSPGGVMLGVKQGVTVVSGTVYRLSARARSPFLRTSKSLMGARVAVNLPNKEERELVWVTECGDWWRQSVLVTNQAAGMATVFIHMGYGQAANTCEFADIQFEPAAQAAASKN
jgi:hypothetical protein